MNRALRERFTAVLARPPFRPAWWLPGAHWQTLFPALVAVPPRVALRLEEIETPDGDVLRLHWLAGAARQPLVVALHGLESSAAAPYVLWLAAALRARGWGLVVAEYRSCGALNRQARLYHAGATDDFDLVMRHVVSRSGDTPRTAVGFSLGGNLLGKWLGEQGAAAPVRAAALIGPPLDLAHCAVAMRGQLGGLYDRAFLRSFRRKIRAKLARHPDTYDMSAIRQCRALTDFDRCVTAPLHGFRSVQHYYQEASCYWYLPDVRVPTLVLAAADDPLCPVGSDLADLAARNDWLVPVVTPAGGHLGFVSGGSPWRPRLWWREQLLRFFDVALAAG